MAVLGNVRQRLSGDVAITYANIPACIYVRDSKSAAGLRTVWLTAHCRDVLVKWRAPLGSDYSVYVFPRIRIPRMHLTDYKTTWRKAGLKDRRIYDLRSTFASRANGCQGSGLTLAHLLGYASTRILPTYVRPLDENTKAVIEALDAARNAYLNKATLIQ
jgi:integrase